MQKGKANEAARQVLREILAMLAQESSKIEKDLALAEQIAPKLKVVLSNLVNRDEVFTLDEKELQEYFTDKLTKKLKVDVLQRIGDLFQRMKEKKAADAREAMQAVIEEIPYACKILKPHEAFSLSLARLNKDELSDLYDKSGVVVEANKLNGMVLVMFSEKHQVWVPRKGVRVTQGAVPLQNIAPKKSDRAVSKYITAAHLREKISTRSTSPRERSRSRSRDKKMVRVKIPGAKELEAAKERTRARLKARMKNKKKMKNRRAKSQEIPRKGRGALFANDIYPIRMPRRRTKSLSEVEKYQLQKDRITIGGLLKKTRDARKIIEDRNFKQRKGTGKSVSYGMPSNAKSASGEPFEDGGGSYAPYDKLGRLEKMAAAQRTDHESGGVSRKRIGTPEEAYQHPVYGNINEVGEYSLNRNTGGSRMVNINDPKAGTQAGWNQEAGYNSSNQGWGTSNQNTSNDGPWGPNQGWGSQVAGNNVSGTGANEAGSTKDEGSNFTSFHDRLFSQHLDGMNGGASTSHYKDSRSLLERLSDKKNRVTLATLKDREAGLTDQLKKFEMHAKPKHTEAPPRSTKTKETVKVEDKRNLFERRRAAKEKHSLTVKKLRNSVNDRRDLSGMPSQRIKTIEFQITDNYHLLYEECLRTFGFEIYKPESIRRLLGSIIHVHSIRKEKNTALFEQDEVIYELPRSCLTLRK